MQSTSCRKLSKHRKMVSHCEPGTLAEGETKKRPVGRCRCSSGRGRGRGGGRGTTTTGGGGRWGNIIEEGHPENIAYER